MKDPRSPVLTLKHEVNGQVDIIYIEGELDVYTASQYRNLAADIRLQGRGRWLVTDLTRCELLDATGLGTIVGALKWARVKNGNMALVIDTDVIQKVFTITGLFNLFTVTSEASQAVEELVAQAARIETDNATSRDSSSEVGNEHDGQLS